ncbi:retron St85 family RNA-directed DNA polymerase [Exercitatus varius]|uniref:retron St85 family RNA-directed DNA polymerase n=1 Tax=Exercitatus varius TaxID=67857 RepID=UPI00294AFBBC|nr:retron St85 family RNA-directed DNA polymerase [Exercitatus varius]MDG2958959.1 retron St85 family RNA-directed DNA polymerase [Exercitatus varius]
MNLSNTLGNILLMDKIALDNFAATAPYRYKIYEIPKRNSSEKRVIAHPAKELKFIQRVLVRKILENLLPIHEAVYSYRTGIGIRDNAYQHLYSKYLLKMDFKSFFPSINPNLFFIQLEKNNIYLSEDDKKIISRLLFWKPKRHSSDLELSVGAPSSPLISNFIMYSFDKRINDFCKDIDIKYTRYADDITFSTNQKDILFLIPNKVCEILNEEYKSSIILNKRKTVFSSKKNNRHVTGVRLSNDNKLSIGRDKKRILSAKLYNFLLGNLDNVSKEKLKGELAFSFYIEPSFKYKLIRKYGAEILHKLYKK